MIFCLCFTPNRYLSLTSFQTFLVSSQFSILWELHNDIVHRLHSWISDFGALRGGDLLDLAILQWDRCGRVRMKRSENWGLALEALLESELFPFPFLLAIFAAFFLNLFLTFSSTSTPVFNRVATSFWMSTWMSTFSSLRFSFLLFLPFLPAPAPPVASRDSSLSLSSSFFLLSA